jgi:hypothetical protein
MKNEKLEIAKEARGIVADMAMAEQKHRSMRRMGRHATKETLVKQVRHRMVHAAGKVATLGYQPKQVEWPVSGDRENVLAYGAEKVAYRIPGKDGAPDSVMAVYHKESIGRDPVEVARQKAGQYGKYREYFGDTVLPTSFMVVDNPWGPGRKPASLAQYLPDAEKLSDLSAGEIAERNHGDPEFARSFQTLQAGYRRMTADGLVPDLAEGNVLVHDSHIYIIDTGALNHTEPGSDNAPMHKSNQRMLDMLDGFPDTADNLMSSK